MRCGRALACAVVILLMASAAPAYAAPTSGDQATAEDLFQRAKVLFTKRDFAAACPMFLESYRLDPAGGTLQNLAVCYEESGKWASAYARYQELRTLSKGGDHPRPDRVKLAEEHIAKLSPRLSRVVVIFPHEIASPTVTLDGVGYLEPSWSAGILVDPGAHEVVVSATGKAPSRITIQTPNDGGQQEVRVPELADVKAPPAKVPPQGEQREATPAREPKRELPVAGIAVGAAGAGLLIAGGIVGLLTFGKNAEADDKCSATGDSARRDQFDASGHCYKNTDAWREANALKEDARTLANVSNVLVGVGIVGLGVGAYLVLTDRPASSSSARTVRIRPTLGGASIAGTF